MSGIDRQAARQKILSAVRVMAREFPDNTYCDARGQFGLLSKVKDICGRVRPTAKECWEAVGLTRSHLTDEFELTQDDTRGSRDTQRKETACEAAATLGSKKND